MAAVKGAIRVPAAFRAIGEKRATDTEVKRAIGEKRAEINATG